MPGHTHTHYDVIVLGTALWVVIDKSSSFRHHKFAHGISVIECLFAVSIDNSVIRVK